MSSDYDRALDAVYAALQEAVDLIDQQLDSPGAMRDALKHVRERLEDLQTEAVIREAANEEQSAALGVLRTQCNRAYRQRDQAYRAFRIANQRLAAWERVIERAKRSGDPDLVAQIRYFLSSHNEP